MKNNFNSENLVTFPSCKNFPSTEQESQKESSRSKSAPCPSTSRLDVKKDVLEDLDDIDALLMEMDCGQQLKTKKSTRSSLQLNNETYEYVMSHKLFPKKLNNSLFHIKLEDTRANNLTGNVIDQQLNELASQISKIKNSQTRINYYLNEIEMYSR